MQHWSSKRFYLQYSAIAGLCQVQTRGVFSVDNTGQMQSLWEADPQRDHVVSTWSFGEKYFRIGSTVVKYLTHLLDDVWRDKEYSLDTWVYTDVCLINASRGATQQVI